MRFRKASSTDNVFHVGAAKGMIGSYPSVNDGAIMSQNGMMYLHLILVHFPLLMEILVPLVLI